MSDCSIKTYEMYKKECRGCQYYIKRGRYRCKLSKHHYMVTAEDCVCKTCLVKVTCTKSMASGHCPMLLESLEKRSEKIKKIHEKLYGVFNYDTLEYDK